MIKKRLSKTLWYGSDVDKEGKPILPPLAKDANDLEGIHEGELYLHLEDGSALLFTRSADGQVVQLGGNADELANYLLKSVWDKAFEIRTTETGEEYLFGKLNFATQYGIASYINGGKLDLPSIFDGLIIDNDTIYWEKTTHEDGSVTKILKSKGGSASFENVKESGEGNAFTSFAFSDDKKTLTFVKGETFAKQSDYVALNTKVTDFLEGSNTDNIINKWKELEAFLSGMKESDDLATILATKWTKDDAKIANWDTAFGWGDHSKAGYMKKSVIYDESLGCWKLDGDLLVTGGITSFANEGKYTPSTIMDGVRVDYDTIIINENGELSINPDIELGGGSGESMTAQQILDKLKSVDGANSGLDADTVDGIDSSKLFVAQRETINRDNLDVFEWRDSGSVQVMRYTSSGAVIDASPLYTFRCNGSYQGFELYQEYNASGPVYKMRSIKDVGAFTPWKTIAFEESLSDTYLPLAGGKMSGHIYMGGAKETSSTSNLSQLIFGTSGNEYVAISSNSDAVIINPNSTSTNGQVILGVNGKASEFTGGEVKVGDISIKRNADGVLLIDGDVIVSGGVTSFVNEGKYTPSTITDGVNVDGQTIIKSGGKLMLNPDIELGGGIESITKQMVIEALGYTPYNSTNPSGYITGITKSMVTTALGFTPYSSANPNGYITSAGSITGNAATATSATTASKLSVKTKKAWGQTYWTNGGVPTDISGDMEGVGNISVDSHGTKSLGADKKGLLHVYTNYINSGHSENNNLWLVGGKANNDVGLIFARGLDSSNHTELGRWNGHGLKVNKAVLCNNYSNLNHIVEIRGGKNLFVDGDGYRGGSGYRVGFYNYDSSVVKGRTYRITMCAKLGVPNTHILAFWAGGSGEAVWIGGLSNEEERVVSFVAKSSSLGSSGGMGFYNYPNTSPNGSYIRWVHMEEACVESDFSTTAQYEEWLASQRAIRPTSFVSNVEQILFGDRTDAQHKSLSVQGDHLRLRGNLLVTGGLASHSTSDERLKENIRTFNAGETLMSLGGAYQFEYCESEVAENKRYEGTHIGLIYQKVKESSLKGMCMEREDGYGALNYLDTDFISLLAAVEMEHEQKVKGLEKKVARLERMVEQLMNK